MYTSGVRDEVLNGVYHALYDEQYHELNEEFTELLYDSIDGALTGILEMTLSGEVNVIMRVEMWEGAD